MNKLNVLNILTITLSLTVVACDRSRFDAGTPKSALVPSKTYSRVKVSSPNFADGVSPAEITVVLRNIDGDPVPNYDVSLTASGSSNTIIPCSKTDGQGVSRCRLYSTRAEWKMLTFEGGIILEQELEFQPLRPFMSSFAVVTAGDQQITMAGNRMITTAGIVESGVAMRDPHTGARVTSSILGSIAD